MLTSADGPKMAKNEEKLAGLGHVRFSVIGQNCSAPSILSFFQSFLIYKKISNFQTGKIKNADTR